MNLPTQSKPVQRETSAASQSKGIAPSSCGCPIACVGACVMGRCLGQCI
jgi:hypothetical protein